LVTNLSSKGIVSSAAKAMLNSGDRNSSLSQAKAGRAAERLAAAAMEVIVEVQVIAIAATVTTVATARIVILEIL
jgi:hypothetical protein